jgi:hypothetical protein
MQAIRITTALGNAGLLPFAIALLAAATDVFDLPVSPQQVFVSYSAVILSFLCGSLWGRLLAAQFSLTVVILLLLTNVLALTAWVSLLSLSWRLEASLGLLVLGYVLVLVTEYAVVGLLYNEVYRGYLRLRSWLTLCVVGMHFAMMIGSRPAM